MRRWLSVLLCLAVLGALPMHAAMADDMGPVSADVDAPVGAAEDFGDTGLSLDEADGEPVEIDVTLDADGEACYGAPTLPEEGDEAPASAAFSYEEGGGEEEEAVYSDEGLSADAAVAEFINRTLCVGDDSGDSHIPRAYIGTNLTGPEKRMYDLLKPQLERVASGDLTSTEFSFSVADLFDEASFTAEDLGLSTLVIDGEISDLALMLFWQRVDPSISKVLNALLLDCPYDLYWFDKSRTGGLYRTAHVPYGSDGERIWINRDTGLYRFHFCVAQEYSLTGETKTFEVDPSTGQAVRAAAANARAIVEANAGKADVAKLTAYKDAICGLVTYNSDAANGGMVYGNPWQLVWVFDGNTSTNVVCEGYSKAFQYLCNMSSFQGDISVVTATGTLRDENSSPGGHMWNIVAINGLNYLADLTNCDANTVGYPDRLFLRGYATKQRDEYCFNQGSRPLYYVFDNDVYCLFRETGTNIDYSDDPVGAETELVRSGSLDSGLTWRMDDQGVLYISGNGPIPDFSDDDPAPWGTGAKKVSLAKGVTGIGKWAFLNCENLCWVTIPVTVVDFSEDAFEGCVNMIGAGNRGLVIVSCGATAACKWADEHIINHSVYHGETETLWEVAPTCTQPGLTQGCRCKICKFVSLPQEEIPPTGVHTYGAWTTTKAATCTSAGAQRRTCTMCGGAAETRDIPAAGHTPQAVQGRAATCTRAGLTDGSKCAVCGEWLTQQRAIPATGHAAQAVQGRAATCTRDGLTDGSKCSVCGEWLTPQRAIPATGHAAQAVKGRAATCTRDGLTDGSKCSVCGEWLTPQRAIPAKSHTAQAVQGRAATCTRAGLTDGSKCAVCGEWLTPQRAIPAKGHDPVDGLFDTRCSVCGETLSRATGWRLYGGAWYYIAAPDTLSTGWQKIGGAWYYFDTSGAMQTGWRKIGGSWYYFNSSGAMATGWRKIGGSWYCFNGSGAMLTGWQKVGGAWYYFGTSGAMATGWQRVGGAWYYFGTSGAMATGWQKIGGAWYYFGTSGAMATGWRRVGGAWYYFGTSGAMATGWRRVGGAWYYFNSSGAMLTGRQAIGGRVYTFDNSGVWVG